MSALGFGFSSALVGFATIGWIWRFVAKRN